MTEHQWKNVGPAQAKARSQMTATSSRRRQVAASQASFPSSGGSMATRSGMYLSESPENIQRQLPLGRAVTQRPEAHQQTPEQFAADPRTWWHGRYAKGSKLTKTGTDEGFHAGTQASARKRLTSNYGRRSPKVVDGNVVTTPARLYPTRLTGRMGDAVVPSRGWGKPSTSLERGSTPQKPAHDRTKHSGLGMLGHGYFYKNEVEDPGHISVGVPRREGYLSTHADMVQRAQEQGKYVHPNIAWAAKKAPAHTGEDAMASKRYTPPATENQHELSQDRTHTGFSPVFSGTSSRGSTEAVHYTNERGQAMSASRHRGGSVMDGKQWEQVGQDDARNWASQK